MKNLDRIDGNVNGVSCVGHTSVTAKRYEQKCNGRQVEQSRLFHHWQNVYQISLIHDVMIINLIRRKSEDALKSYKSKFNQVLFRKARMIVKFSRISILPCSKKVKTECFSKKVFL
jgi:hypothetical protein